MGDCASQTGCRSCPAMTVVGIPLEERPLAEDMRTVLSRLRLWEYSGVEQDEEA